MSSAAVMPPLAAPSNVRTFFDLMDIMTNMMMFHHDSFISIVCFTSHTHACQLQSQFDLQYITYKQTMKRT